MRGKLKGAQLLAQNKALEGAIVRGERELRLHVLEQERLIDTLRQELRELVSRNGTCGAALPRDGGGERRRAE